ncbi:hypothetical protein ACLMJK_007632 [Lecanora helva]
MSSEHDTAKSSAKWLLENPGRVYDAMVPLMNLFKAAKDIVRYYIFPHQEAAEEDQDMSSSADSEHTQKSTDQVRVTELQEVGHELLLGIINLRDALNNAGVKLDDDQTGRLIDKAVKTLGCRQDPSCGEIVASLCDDDPEQQPISAQQHLEIPPEVLDDTVKSEPAPELEDNHDQTAHPDGESTVTEEQEMSNSQVKHAASFEWRRLANMSSSKDSTKSTQCAMFCDSNETETLTNSSDNVHPSSSTRAALLGHLDEVVVNDPVSKKTSTGDVPSTNSAKSAKEPMKDVEEKIDTKHTLYDLNAAEDYLSMAQALTVLGLEPLPYDLKAASCMPDERQEEPSVTVVTKQVSIETSTAKPRIEESKPILATTIERSVNFEKDKEVTLDVMTEVKATVLETREQSGTKNGTLVDTGAKDDKATHGKQNEKSTQKDESSRPKQLFGSLTELPSIKHLATPEMQELKRKGLVTPDTSDDGNEASKLSGIFIPEEEGEGLAHVFPANPNSYDPNAAVPLGKKTGFVDGTLTNLGFVDDESDPEEQATTAAEITESKDIKGKNSKDEASCFVPEEEGTGLSHVFVGSREKNPHASGKLTMVDGTLTKFGKGEGHSDDEPKKSTPAENPETATETTTESAVDKIADQHEQQSPGPKSPNVDKDCRSEPAANLSKGKGKETVESVMPKYDENISEESPTTDPSSTENEVVGSTASNDGEKKSEKSVAEPELDQNAPKTPSDDEEEASNLAPLLSTPSKVKPTQDTKEKPYSIYFGQMHVKVDKKPHFEPDHGMDAIDTQKESASSDIEALKKTTNNISEMASGEPLVGVPKYPKFDPRHAIETIRTSDVRVFSANSASTASSSDKRTVSNASTSTAIATPLKNPWNMRDASISSTTQTSPATAQTSPNSSGSPSEARGGSSQDTTPSKTTSSTSGSAPSESKNPDGRLSATQKRNAQRRRAKARKAQEAKEAKD